MDYFQTALACLIDSCPLSGLDKNDIAELFLQLFCYNITNEVKKKCFEYAAALNEEAEVMGCYIEKGACMDKVEQTSGLYNP